MQPTFSYSDSGGSLSGLIFLAAIWGIFVAIFWMVVGWRAMRAHERLADATENIARTKEHSGGL